MTHWIEWYAQKTKTKGPLPNDAAVEVMMVNGNCEIDAADNFHWDVVDHAHEIIVYRHVGKIIMRFPPGIVFTPELMNKIMKHLLL